MPELDIGSAILRGAHFTALASLFGTLLFDTAILGRLPRAAWAERTRSRLQRLARLSLLVALVLGALWFVSRASAIAGAATIGEAFDAVGPVAIDTKFGHLVLVRLALLLALLPFCQGATKSTIHGDLSPPAKPRSDAGRSSTSPFQRTERPPAASLLWFRLSAILLAGCALAIQALSSHFGAMEGVVGVELVITESLHVLAAGAWLGALAPLLICLSTVPADAKARVLRRFFPLGLLAVLVIAGTSVVQALSLVASVPALVGTAFGLVALAKTLLFLSLLVLAALNRFVFGARPANHLRRSIIGEMALAVLTFLAAAVLAHLTPGAHEQPVWPFAWRLNPSTTGPVFIEAQPASFFMSPTGFSADAVIRGEALYQRACASCHGATAQGRGPAAASLSVAPPDLTTDRVRAYSDGDLFWKTGHSGIAADADRWDLVDYLRAHATGEFARTSGRGQLTLRIPKFDAVCPGGEALDRDDLRGKVLRLVVPGDRPPLLLPPDADPRLMTISLLAGPDGWPGTALCTAQPGTLRALSILLGTTPEALAGYEYLIDGSGWLRARWRPGQRGGWGTPELLRSRVETLARSPLPADPGSAHVHHH